jgi:hypothetical protein
MAARASALAVLALVAVSTPAWADPALRVEHAAARMVVIPENRPDVAYTIQPGHAGLPPIQMHRDGGVMVLDGGLGGGFMGRSRIQGCDSWDASHRTDDRTSWNINFGKAVRIAGIGSVKVQDLPVITVHVPMNANVSAGGAVFGEIGPSASLVFANAGCGDWKVADVRGTARFNLAGSGDVHADSAGDARVNIAGSGDLFFESAGGLNVHIAGSGDVRGRAVNGPIDAKIAGSGDVFVEGGRASDVSAAITGSGDLRFKGEAGAVNASIVGSGNVDVARVTGAIVKHVVGSGEVNVGR